MLVLKRKNLIIVTVFALIAVTFVLCCTALIKSSAATGKTAVKIVLDAGHGGIDGGVSGKITGVKESDINLSIVKKTEKYFIDAGINVVLTRSSEAGLYGVASATLKRRDMEKRREIIKKTQPTLVISVHQNFFPSSSRRGGQVFYASGRENSEKLAERVQNSLNALYEDVKDYTPLTGDYYILNCTEYPSIIAECGFLSNPKDEELLITEEFQNKIAYAIFAGTIDYLAQSSIAFF